MGFNITPPADERDALQKILDAVTQAQAGKLQRATALEMARQLAASALAPKDEPVAAEPEAEEAEEPKAKKKGAK